MKTILRIVLTMCGSFVSPDFVLAEDWGVYGIASGSAPALVLEAVEAGTADGTVVSVNKPSGAAHQKWRVVPKDAGYYAITAAHDLSLVLSAAAGGTKNGTAIVLEKDSGKPSLLQLYSSLKGSQSLSNRRVHILKHFSRHRADFEPKKSRAFFGQNFAESGFQIAEVPEM